MRIENFIIRAITLIVVIMIATLPVLAVQDGADAVADNPVVNEAESQPGQQDPVIQDADATRAANQTESQVVPASENTEISSDGQSEVTPEQDNGPKVNWNTEEFGNYDSTDTSATYVLQFKDEAWTIVEKLGESETTAHIIQNENGTWQVVADLKDTENNTPVVIQKQGVKWNISQKYEAVYCGSENKLEEEDEHAVLTIKKDESRGWEITHCLSSETVFPYVFIVATAVLIDLLLMIAAVIFVLKRNE